jgi:hypothetical protein
MTSEESLRRELEDAFQNRAHLYRLLLEELEIELGPDRAEAVMRRTLQRRGQEVAGMLFLELPADAVTLGDRFLSVSPDEGRMYPYDAERGAGCMTIRVHRCPLKDAWQAAGLAPARVAQLCRIAGAFDKGLFEAAGLAFSNETWNEARGGGCCWITLQTSSGC